MPKSKQKLYGKIVGHMQNLGKSLESSKDIADEAITPRSQRGTAQQSKGEAKPSKSRLRQERSKTKDLEKKAKKFTIRTKF